MATSPANPQAPAPGPPQGAGADPSSQQANPLQETLGKLILMMRQLGQQNQVIQEDLQQASSVLIKALQKVSQASSGPAQPPGAAPQAG